MMEELPPPVARWFGCWNTGAIDDLPITDDFRHTSPFGTIETKARYLEIVNKNRDSFLGNKLTVLRQIVDGDRIREIESFYNIGDAVIQG